VLNHGIVYGYISKIVKLVESKCYFIIICDSMRRRIVLSLF